MVKVARQCLAGRVLLQDSAASLVFQPTRSIVQGLRSGTRFGRCLTYHTLHGMVLESPRLLMPRIWVDVLSPSKVGSRAAVVDELGKSII